MMKLDILFQDEQLVAVYKPPGLLVHRSDIDIRATEFAVQLLRDQIGQRVFPVHRLDRPTSGVLLFALSQDSARAVAMQFQENQVEKRYLAMVRGSFPQQIMLDYPLREEIDCHSDEKKHGEMPVQAAVTEFRRLDICEFPVCVDKYPTSQYSLILAQPKTGRKHQIRRHLRHLGFPIVGDVRYGSGKHNRFFREAFAVRDLLLACVSLGFIHPATGSTMEISSPLRFGFADFLSQGFGPTWVRDRQFSYPAS